MLHCFEETPHPITPSPLPSPQGRGKRGTGSWGEGSLQAWQWNCSQRDTILQRASVRGHEATFHPTVRNCVAAILLILAAGPLLAARTETWTEVRSPDFLVLTDSSAKQGRLVALQFEAIRAVFRQFFNIPASMKEPVITIIAVKDEDDLKRLIPELGSAPSGGVFISGPEKTYIALRLDRLDIERESEGFGGRAYDPFASVHRGYVHFLAGQLLSELPPWMVEGLAAFFGSARLEYMQITFGAPSGANIKVLHSAKLLPLATLLAVNADSPCCQGGGESSVFRAQSWLLAKYLATRDWREGTHRVRDLVDLLKSEDPEEAARHSIGDPVSLQKELQRYLLFHLYSVARQPMPPSLDAQNFTAAAAPPAESAAMRADFMALNAHGAEEQKRLEAALEIAGSEPMIGQHEEATAAQAEASLRAAIKEAPQVAEPYEALANLLARHPETQDEAYQLALKAVSLKPAMFITGSTSPGCWR